MKLKQLKNETKQLPQVDKLVSNFRKHWVTVEFLNHLSIERRSEVAVQLKALKKSLNEIAYGQVVNEKLASLAHHLVDLKIASVMNDHRRTKRIVTTILNDPHASIKKLIFEVPYLESQLSLLHKSYNCIVDELSSELPLEHSTELLDGTHRAALKRLMAVSEKQKMYLSHIGKHFVDMTRALKKEKEFRKRFR